MNKHTNDEEDYNMKTILVAEDDTDLRELIAFSLIQAGYRVLECSNESEAIVILAENYHVIKLIILNLALPLIKGGKIVRELKQDPILKQIPLLLCMTDESADIIQAINMRIDRCICKPFSVQNDLLPYVQTLLNQNDTCCESEKSLGVTQLGTPPSLAAGR
jgi:two-component system, OmpR family, phosphate regulon response regulator PhoB